MPMTTSDARKRLAEQILAEAPDVRQRLLTLHKPNPAGFCNDDGQHWPCKTARILEDHT